MNPEPTTNLDKSLNFLDFKSDNLIEDNQSYDTNPTILTQLSDESLIFSCLKCNAFLFPSSHIISLLHISKQTFAFILDEIDFNTTIKSETPLHSNDDFFEQNDTLFSMIVCNKCKERLGSEIEFAGYEKNFLCDKALIRSDRVVIYKANNFGLERCEFRLGKDEIENSEEMKTVRIWKKKQNDFVEKLKYIQMFGDNKKSKLLKKIEGVNKDWVEVQTIWNYLVYKTQVNNRKNN